MPSPTYNPASVMLSQGSGAPYIGSGASTIRATGSGPFDANYRQNLAIYAGGLLGNKGNLNFNPTSSNPFANMGTPTGGGSAPLMGLPQTWLQQALGTSLSSQQPGSTGGPQGSTGSGSKLPTWSLFGYNYSPFPFSYGG